MIGFTAAERELLGRIAEVFAVLDPVPDAVWQAARDSALVLRPTRTWRRLELLRDNVMSARERSLGFGPGGLDVLVRRAGRGAVVLRGSVESCAAPAVGTGRGLGVLEVAPATGSVRELGTAGGCAAPEAGKVRELGTEPAAGRVRRLVDRGAAAVWVRWPGGAGRALVDSSGRFSLGEVPSGPICLAVTGKSAGMALTPWFVC